MHKSPLLCNKRRNKHIVPDPVCIWIPQTMKEKAVCFISENLVILLPE